MELKDHPAAAIFPLIPEAELTELADSIAKNGQRDDIITVDGLIVDGRNRYRACRMAGVTPRVTVYDPKKHGTSVLDFILDANLYRRHLSTSQRAVIAANALRAMSDAAEARRKAREESGATPPGQAMADGTLVEDDEPVAEVPTQQEIAKIAHVSERSLSDAMVVTTDPEIAGKVAGGEMSVSKGAREVKKSKAAAGEKKTGKGQVAGLTREQLEERRKHIARIRANCGEAFAQAFIDQEVLKTVKETAAFLALDDETQKLAAPLVSTGWAVKKAAAHVTHAITGNTTLDTIINRAIANSGTFITTFNGYEIAVTKIA